MSVVPCLQTSRGHNPCAFAGMLEMASRDGFHICTVVVQQCRRQRRWQTQRNRVSRMSAKFGWQSFNTLKSDSASARKSAITPTCLITGPHLPMKILCSIGWTYYPYSPPSLIYLTVLLAQNYSAPPLGVLTIPPRSPVDGLHTRNSRNCEL